MRAVVMAAVGLVVALVARDAPAGGDDAAGTAGGTTMTEAESLRHDNGLALPRPDGFAVETTADGFVLTEEWVRQIRRSTLTLHPDEASLHAAGLSVPQGAERDGIPFAVRELGSGSGGTEHELTAVREVEGGLLALHAIEQTEGAEPGFEFAWALLRAAQVRR
jgi:hypothetical protein